MLGWLGGSCHRAVASRVLSALEGSVAVGGEAGDGESGQGGAAAGNRCGTAWRGAGATQGCPGQGDKCPLSLGCLVAEPVRGREGLQSHCGSLARSLCLPAWVPLAGGTKPTGVMG